ncbi:MAG: hypothetical protein OXG78_06400 [Chloroflexi bacterium]|nr:hypothetical protein [Chloroflexota bacterium]
MKTLWRKTNIGGLFGLTGLLLMTGCQALGGGDSVATIGADLTEYAVEGGAILAAATAERNMAVETIVAASTRVAELSEVNAALGATLRANYTSTPEVQVVVVSAEDMGSSLGDDMMDDSAGTAVAAGDMQVSNLATAAAIDENSGCSSGLVSDFSSAAERIYVTAHVTSLQSGTEFRVDWLRQGELLYDISWEADYSKSFECIWFYVAPADFAFAPGDYSARLLVDGLETGSAPFSIFGG